MIRQSYATKCPVLLRPCVPRRTRHWNNVQLSERSSSSTAPPAPSHNGRVDFQPKKVDVEALLSSPSWDPRSLLSGGQPASNATHLPDAELEVDLPTPTQLRHLLRLSALPPPKDEAEERAMLSTLAAQLRFVAQVRAVDTRGVEPLAAIRDETAAAIAKAEVDADKVRDALDAEEVRGRYAPRIRRRPVVEDGEKAAGEQGLDGQPRRDGPEGKWDVLGHANRKVGRYFVVERTKV